MSISEKSRLSKGRRRVKGWRKRLSDKGGKLIQIPLNEEDVKLLKSLQESHGDMTLGELFSTALKALARECKVTEEASPSPAFESPLLVGFDELSTEIPESGESTDIISAESSETKKTKYKSWAERVELTAKWKFDP